MNSPSATPTKIRVPIKVRLLAAVIPVAVVAGFFAWQHFYPVVAARGWSSQVVYTNIQKAASLAYAENGDLVVTEELPDSAGRLLSIDSRGSREVLLSSLSKPDGLASFAGGFVFSQEGGAFPVSLFRDGVVTPLFDAINAQGITASGDKLYVVEDRKGNGRLFEYDLTTKTAKVLRSSLDEAESFTVCPNGDEFYTEKAKGYVRRFTKDGTDPVFLGPDLLREPSFLRCDRNGLWVVEDRTHLARLLLVDGVGNAKVVLSHLRAPQVLLGNKNEDSYLLAEGGRNRVIKLSKDVNN